MFPDVLLSLLYNMQIMYVSGVFQSHKQQQWMNSVMNIVA